LIARAWTCQSRQQFPEAAMSKKGDRFRDKAEELRADADDIRAEECHRISLALAERPKRGAVQWDAIELTMVGYLGNRAPAK
jgi:hypothetical protein